MDRENSPLSRVLLHPPPPPPTHTPLPTLRPLRTLSHSPHFSDPDTAAVCHHNQSEWLKIEARQSLQDHRGFYSGKGSTVSNKMASAVVCGVWCVVCGLGSVVSCWGVLGSVLAECASTACGFRE